MKRYTLTGLLVLALAPAVWADTAPVYQNVGVVANPQIDAQTVINAGTIVTMTSLPFDTQNTLYYTNVTTVPSLAPSPKVYAAYAYTNKITPSNLLVQVVFVATNNPDTNIQTSTQFAPALAEGLFWPIPDPTDRAQIAVVQFSLAG